MVFKMARPTKLPGSRLPYARKVVPQELQIPFLTDPWTDTLRGSTVPIFRRWARD
jgi:hypothetical protein